MPTFYLADRYGLATNLTLHKILLGHDLSVQISSNSVIPLEPNPALGLLVCDGIRGKDSTTAQLPHSFKVSFSLQQN